jgi:hypothetical protein
VNIEYTLVTEYLLTTEGTMDMSALSAVDQRRWRHARLASCGCFFAAGILLTVSQFGLTLSDVSLLSRLPF